jgi:hypothetical protein
MVAHVVVSGARVFEILRAKRALISALAAMRCFMLTTLGFGDKTFIAMVTFVRFDTIVAHNMGLHGVFIIKSFAAIGLRAEIIVFQSGVVNLISFGRHY